MNNLGLRKNTQTDIRMYLISTQGTQYEQNQLEDFFKLISPSLKERVSIEIFIEVVKNNLQMSSAILQIAKQYLVDNPYPKIPLIEAETRIIRPIVTKMET